MVRDDRDNKWVDASFCILLVLNVALLLFTLLKLYKAILAASRSYHIYLLYLAIAIYSLRTRHAVRIVWYFDIVAHFNIEVYYILEDLPVLPLFGAYSTISCLWYSESRLELYLMFRTARGCSKKMLHIVRGSFITLNVLISIAFISIEVLKAKLGQSLVTY